MSIASIEHSPTWYHIHKLEVDSMKPHQANQAFWDASVHWWQEREDQRGLWMKAHQDPSSVLSSVETPFFKQIEGKEVCVLGSGANEVAFSWVGLGGRVTSVDLSERRLDIAANRARRLEHQLSFLQADVTDLSVLADNSFDLVYTGGYMSVWVSDIHMCYAEAVRILKAGGLLVVNEYHPVRRIWLDGDGEQPCHCHFNRGPYQYTPDEGLPTFEYHWTVADHNQVVVDAGCVIVQVEEHDQQIEDEFWREADLHKLPANLMVAGQKRLLNQRPGKIA